MIEMAKKWAKISYTFLLVYICQVSFACDTSARKRCNLFLSPTIETLNEVVTFYEASSYGRWRNFYPGLKFFSRQLRNEPSLLFRKRKKNPSQKNSTENTRSKYQNEIDLSLFFQNLFLSSLKNQSLHLRFLKIRRKVSRSISEKSLMTQLVNRAHYRLLVFLTGPKEIIYV